MPAVLVFGARNLGRAIARHMNDRGWDVAAFATSDDSLERLAGEVGGALTIKGDARNEADVERAFSRAKQAFGSVDLVVVSINPSSRSGGVVGGSVLEAEARALTPYTEDLLPALYTILRHGSRALTEQGSGTYVQITGGSARRGMPGRGPWAAGAAATRALIQSAAGELREKGVHVALLIVDATIESEKTQERIAGRHAEESTSEQDVAQAVAYLASQSTRAMTHELQITPARDRWTP